MNNHIFKTPTNKIDKNKMINNLQQPTFLHKKNKTNLILPDYISNISLRDNSLNNKKINKDIINKYTKNINNIFNLNNKCFQKNEEINTEIGRLTTNNNYNRIDDQLDYITSKGTNQDLWQYHIKIE